MKFKNVGEELEFSQKRYRLKNDIEKLFIEKNYINYDEHLEINTDPKKSRAISKNQD